MKKLTRKQQLINLISSLEEQFESCGNKWEHVTITPRTTQYALMAILDEGNKLFKSLVKSPWDALVERLCKAYAENKGENGHQHLFFKGQYVANKDNMALTDDLKAATLRVVKTYKKYKPEWEDNWVFDKCMDELVKRRILNKILYKGNVYYRATDTQLQKMKEIGEEA